MNRLALFLSVFLSFHLASAASFVCENQENRIEVIAIDEEFRGVGSQNPTSSSMQGVLIRSSIPLTARSKFMSGPVFLDANHLSPLRSDLSCYGNVLFNGDSGMDYTHSLTYNASAYIQPQMDIELNTDVAKDFFIAYKVSSPTISGGALSKLNVKFEKSDCDPQAEQVLYQSFVKDHLMATNEILREVAEGIEKQDSICYYQRDLTYSE